MAIVKSYIGNTQKEAFDKVKAELGNEAIIINTRKIRRRGLWSFFKKPIIEITAVLDESNLNTSKGKANAAQTDEGDLKQLINDTLKNEKLAKIEKQMIQVSDAVNKVYKDVDLIKNKELVQFQPELQKLIKELIESGVSQENAMKIINEAKTIIEKDGIEPKAVVSSIINRYLGEPSPIELAENDRKVVIFIGPTGVGKTTTLAKIAAIFSLHNNAKVGLVTEDTYRIGAVEQLKIYADILSLPLEVVYEPNEIKNIMEKMNDLDLILIDTAGKSPLDKTYHENLKKLVDESGAQEVHLVISATTEYSAAMVILQSYSFIENYKILFTKLDECDKWGNILNIKMLADKQMSYATNGQNVADDILLARPEFIAKKFFTDGGEIDGSGVSTEKDCIDA